MAPKPGNVNRKQKQRRSAQAGEAVAAARGSHKDFTKVIAAGVVVIVIAAAVVGGVLFEQHKKSLAAQAVIPARTVAGSSRYPVSLDKTDATVLAGKSTAKITVDAYEDFECPICRDFESRYFTGIEKQLQAGTVKVR